MQQEKFESRYVEVMGHHHVAGADRSTSARAASFRSQRHAI